MIDPQLLTQFGMAGAFIGFLVWLVKDQRTTIGKIVKYKDSKIHDLMNTILKKDEENKKLTMEFVKSRNDCRVALIANEKALIGNQQAITELTAEIKNGHKRK